MKRFLPTQHQKMDLQQNTTTNIRRSKANLMHVMRQPRRQKERRKKIVQQSTILNVALQETHCEK
jgi:hypothetical protein